MADIADTTPVTVMVARRVAPGREADFEEWSAELTRVAHGFPGFLGAGLLRPGFVGEPWHVVFRFATRRQLQGWERSAERAALIAAADELVHSTSQHRVSGLETWFSLPGRTAPAPPKWKMFTISVVAIYVLQLGANLAVGSLGLAVPLRIALVAVAVTALMTWLIMPRAARVLEPWLYGANVRS